MRLFLLVVCLAVIGTRAQGAAPSALAELQSAALAAEAGHWADGSPARPSLVAAGEKGETLPAPVINVEPPPFDDGADGAFLGLSAGIIDMERPALEARRVPVVGTPLAVALFVILLIPALIWGLINAALTA